MAAKTLTIRARLNSADIRDVEVSLEDTLRELKRKALSAFYPEGQADPDNFTLVYDKRIVGDDALDQSIGQAGLQAQELVDLAPRRSGSG